MLGFTYRDGTIFDPAGRQIAVACSAPDAKTILRALNTPEDPQPTLRYRLDAHVDHIYERKVVISGRLIEGKPEFENQTQGWFARLRTDPPISIFLGAERPDLQPGPIRLILEPKT